MVGIKVCGVMSALDAEVCVAAGVDLVGINFWPESPRYVPPEDALAIVEAVGERATVVGVFVDAEPGDVEAVRAQTGIVWAQLHGQEGPSELGRLLPEAYKALRVDGPDIVRRARAFGGEHILLDAAVKGLMGGTGETFDWNWARAVAAERRVTLAGGLTPDNVAEAIRIVRPYRVDVASGVEEAPGRKNPRLVRRFVNAVRSVHDD